MSRIKYLLWAFTNSSTSDISCPACGSATKLVRRKYGVTALRECSACFIRFRTPKNDEGSAKKFYANELYKQGFTTDLPSDAELTAMLAKRFAGTDKDFAPRIEVLRAAGLKPGKRILDFGSSWGYGSWQMKQAGFEVFSYEIGRDRARYARDKLRCKMTTNLRELYKSVDCFFASHVIEHLTDPNILFDEASRVLKPNGLLICYCPNGAMEREQKHGIKSYDRYWGMVHPLMVTPNYMRREATKRHFARCYLFSNPVRPADILAHCDGTLDGDELLTIAYQRE